MTNAFKKTALSLMTVAALTAVAGCQSTTVSRVDTNTEVALTDRWNATDSRLVSEEMISDMLSFPWAADYERQNPGKRPTVIIQRIRNKSHEHIAVETFSNDLKRAVIRSGRADFVAGGSERDDVRSERRDQEFNARTDTQVAMGEETGARFALSGSINSFVDSLDGDRVTSYQVDLKLIDMLTNREVWNGTKKIQKFQEKSSFGF
ncbi:penicillin-binding protein activator LpoB [Litoribrevibacter euphylliae]|uniref:Penicillin-binding protein activator LpoB n=1 Tax=Litoribrevibacter euphylliae TaxID=1834034 RepID=A0ABV7HDM4_9GAMM